MNTQHCTISKHYSLSLHDALPISTSKSSACASATASPRDSTSSRAHSTPQSRTSSSNPSSRTPYATASRRAPRSEEHTSELQSRQYLVFRLLFEKKKSI